MGVRGMDRKSKIAWQACLASGAFAMIAGLAGCNESPPPAPPPPPVAAYQPPPPPPPLLGAPPPRQFITMVPIPNPPERGRRAHHWGHRHGDHSPGWWLRAHGYTSGSTPVRQAAAPAPAVPAPTPKPVVTPPPAVAQQPSPLAQLSAAVTDKSKGATLSAPADLSAAKPGAVTLSLPADLLSVIRDEAAKLGMGKAAKKTDVTATLHGDGYTVTPPGPQTASLAAGKPATFTWQVAPGPNAKGPLTADVNAVLKGAGDAKTFALATLSQAVAAVDAAAQKAEAASNGFKLPSLDMLSIPGHKDLTLPVVGKTPSKSVVEALLALLVLFLLLMFARNASARRETETQRRRYRTMASATPALGLAEPAETHVEHVLAPDAAHAHVVEAPVARDHEIAPAADHVAVDDHAIPAHEPPTRHYEGPSLVPAPLADDHGHTEPAHTAETHDEAHAGDAHDSHATPDHSVEAVHVADEHHADEHQVEPAAHTADDHAAAEDHAASDHHAVAEPVVDHHQPAPVGDYMPIGDHADADHHEVVHVAADHAEPPAAEDHAEADHPSAEPAAEAHGHDDHHHGHGASRHLELESI